MRTYSLPRRRAGRRASPLLISLALPLVGSPPAAAQSTPPVSISPPSSAENPAPAPFTSTVVPPVNVDVRPPQAPVIDPAARVAVPVAGPPPLPVSEGPQDVRLPGPAARPLDLDPADDPLLASVLVSAPADGFRALVQAAVVRHPGLDETSGYAEEARYALYQQEAAKAPSGELNIVGFQVLGRQFSGDSVDNIVERTRANRRFDELAVVNQLITDFGATNARIDAAGARLRAAALGVDNAADQVALNTIAAWYDVYSLRTIMALTSAYQQDSLKNREGVRKRIAGGVSAQSDAALIENALAQLDIRSARYAQQLSSAEARFRELTGAPPPLGLMRAPELGTPPETIEEARTAADTTPAARAAREQEVAARRDARAAERDLFPTVGASINAGRYGLLESPRDYDVVARITLRQRFFGGLPQRAKGAAAHASAIAARTTRISEEGRRDAAVAFSDLEALDRQLEAMKASYAATRITRDATVERFRFSRGTIFDVLNASDTFYAAAISYVQALAQRDAARYVLLSRTGRLLDALAIPKYIVRD
ncbi:TolC family protein [Sphingomonas sp. M1-B02]|uniref:TolC family protein n=1 Tax=Sphingomonas sp. M1-B02 TaxID=3114300 RepID=UPI00223FF10E|nr:TolC family protein [Sphingomonas sp. S6-11]UZK65043.1 TolC family protein [Sphingomonas sp. S6-11]